jgi:hypothetical protein
LQFLGAHRGGELFDAVPAVGVEHVGIGQLLQEEAAGGVGRRRQPQARRLLLGLFEVMLENFGQRRAGQRHHALVGALGGLRLQGQHQPAVAEQVGDAADVGVGPGREFALGHAAQVQLLVAVHHQHRDRAVALQLEAEAAGGLQVAADDGGDGGQFAEQFAHRRRVVAPAGHRRPGGPELHQRAADVEVFEQEAVDLVHD